MGYTGHLRIVSKKCERGEQCLWSTQPKLKSRLFRMSWMTSARRAANAWPAVYAVPRQSCNWTQGNRHSSTPTGATVAAPVFPPVPMEQFRSTDSRPHPPLPLIQSRPSCPVQVPYPQVIPELCRRCPRCPAAERCPSNSLVQLGRKRPPVISYRSCYGCQVCATACPYKAIRATWNARDSAAKPTL
jgi:Pyruvate/2-oxoacid:ferredoxin oxidoreductase delta subunit